MIKSVIKGFLRRVRYRPQEPAYQPTEEEKIIERGKEIIKKISPDYAVLNGIFKGLKYPSLDITEAALVPKIVGSYESQLHPVIQKIIGTSYSHVIDVGCAEGYYAVGLAFKMPATIVHGFDINEKDLEFCRLMAQQNDVTNISFNKFCSPETLTNFNFGSKGLVFSDCEGYELDLFTPEVITALANKNTDVLVELHDVLKPGITSELLVRFKDTYNIKIVSTNAERPTNWQGLNELSESEKDFAVFEHRGGINANVYMEWAFFTVKPNNRFE